MTKTEALATYFDVSAEKVERMQYDHYGLSLFDVDGEEYAISTDEEADAAAKEYIEDTLWAFNASFLSDMTDISVEMFQAVQGKCEDANDPIRTVVDATCGIDDLVSEAISADGRGHFLSPYGGEENEEGKFFIYRVN